MAYGCIGFTPPAVREFLKIKLMMMTIYEYMPLKQKTQKNQRFNQYTSFIVDLRSFLSLVCGIHQLDGQPEPISLYSSSERFVNLGT
jgi:hypothetical protein